MNKLALLLLIPVAFAVNDAGQSQGFAARITLLDGTVRTATLEGFGRPEGICSRIVMKGKNEDNQEVSFPIRSIAAIENSSAQGAVVVMKDGARQRISLVTNFRIAYLANLLFPQKVDLTRIKSLEFVPTQH